MSKSSTNEPHSKAIFKRVQLGASLGANEAGPVTEWWERTDTNPGQSFAGKRWRG